MANNPQKFNASDLIKIHLNDPGVPLLNHPPFKVNPEVKLRYKCISEEQAKNDSIQWKSPSGSPTKYFTEIGETIHKNSEFGTFSRKVRKSENRQKWQAELLPPCPVYQIIFKYGESGELKRRISIVSRIDNDSEDKTWIVEYISNDQLKKRKRQSNNRPSQSTVMSPVSCPNSQESERVTISSIESIDFSNEKENGMERYIEDLAEGFSNTIISDSILAAIDINSSGHPPSKTFCPDNSTEDLRLISSSALNQILDSCGSITTANPEELGTFNNSNIFIGVYLRNHKGLGKIQPIDPNLEVLYKVASKYEEKKDREWEALLKLNDKFYMWSVPYLISDKSGKCLCLRFDLHSSESNQFFIKIRSLKDSLLSKCKMTFPVKFDMCAKIGEAGKWTCKQSFTIRDDNSNLETGLPVPLRSTDSVDKMPSIYLKMTKPF